MRGSPTEDFVDAGVVFDVRAFCPQLKDTSRDALKDVDEVTLHNLDTGREATHELGEQLPRLERLRFRQSKLCSFRDLGCDLLNLRVLHAARCGVSPRRLLPVSLPVGVACVFAFAFARVVRLVVHVCACARVCARVRTCARGCDIK